MQVLKGIHGGIREVALKMLQDVEDPQNELERFTQVMHCCASQMSGPHMSLMLGDNMMLLQALHA